MKKKEVEHLPMFFIIGRPRSGTTLLTTLFGAHPNVAIPFECPFILELYGKYGAKQTWTAEDIRAFYENLYETRFFKAWPVDREKLLDDLSSCIGDSSFKTLAKVVITNFISVYPKQDIQLVGDKNPLYSFHFKRIFRLFPEAKYIHLTRDYRDIAVSNQKASFGISVPFVALNWRRSFIIINPYKKKYPEQFFTLRYEDLVRDPEGYLGQACKFLKIRYAPEALGFYKKKKEYTETFPTEIFEGVHKSLFNPISTDKVSVWKTKLADNMVRICDLIVGKYAEDMGYERKYPGFSLARYLSLIPVFLYWRFLLVGSTFARAMPFHMRKQIKRKKPPLAGFFRRLYGEKKKERRWVAEFEKHKKNE